MQVREFHPFECLVFTLQSPCSLYHLIPLSIQDITALIDHHEIHLILVTNPDGRKKAEQGILWRKNTNNNFCRNLNSRGVDLNRNFPYKWVRLYMCVQFKPLLQLKLSHFLNQFHSLYLLLKGGTGASTNQCDQTYQGPSAKSEPETNIVLNYMKTIFPTNQKGPEPNDPSPDDATGVAIDVHSYGVSYYRLLFLHKCHLWMLNSTYTLVSLLLVLRVRVSFSIRGDIR